MKKLSLILLFALASASSVFGAKITVDELLSCTRCNYGTIYYSKQKQDCIEKCNFATKDLSNKIYEFASDDGTISNENTNHYPILNGVDFSGANLESVVFKKNDGTKSQGTFLSGWHFNNTNFSGANLKKMTIKSSFSVPSSLGMTSTFSGANFKNADLSGVKFVKATYKQLDKLITPVKDEIPVCLVDLQSQSDGYGDSTQQFFKDACIYGVKGLSDDDKELLKTCGGATDDPNSASCKIGS